MEFAQSLLILLHLQVCVCETERKILINKNVLQMADHVKHKWERERKPFKYFFPDYEIYKQIAK